MGSTAAAPKGSAFSGSSASSLVNAFPLIFVFVVFYFLVIRPQQRQEKDRKSMVDALKIGDRVLTQGGVYGQVASVKGDSVLLRLTEGKMEVSRAAITKVFAEGANGVPVAAGEKNS